MADIDEGTVEKISSGGATPDEIKQTVKAIVERDVAALGPAVGMEGVGVGELTRVYDRGLWRVPLIMGERTRWFGLTPEFLPAHIKDMYNMSDEWKAYLTKCLEELKEGAIGNLGGGVTPGWVKKTLTELKIP